MVSVKSTCALYKEQDSINWGTEERVLNSVELNQDGTLPIAIQALEGI